MPITHPPELVADHEDVYVLRVDILDLLMEAKGIKSVAAQARSAKISRSTLFRLRKTTEPGERPATASLSTARRLARAAGTTVETLFAYGLADQ